MLRVGEVEHPISESGVLAALEHRPVQLVDLEAGERYLFARSADNRLWSVATEQKELLINCLRPMIGRLLAPTDPELAERLEWLEPAAYVERMLEPLPVEEVDGEPVSHGFPIELLRCLGATPLEYLPVVALFLNRCVRLAEPEDPLVSFDRWLPEGEEIDRAIAYWIRKKAPKGRLKIVTEESG